MTKLTAIFELVDKISDKLDSISNSGENSIGVWEKMGSAADSAQSTVETAAGNMKDASFEFIESVEEAAGTTDYWTNAAEGFNKSMLDAVYSTEELVEMGMKSADALREEQSVAEGVSESISDLNNAVDKSAEVSEKATEAWENSCNILDSVAESDKVSAETKEKLSEATEDVAQALSKLEEAQETAQEAMDRYNAVAESGTATLTELEVAGMNAGNAAEYLAARNAEAEKATEKLTQTTEEATKEIEEAGEDMDDFGEEGIAAIEGIASALAAAGITKAIKEIANAVYELTDAFSEAESTIVLATGATGDALNSLTDSMMSTYSSSMTGSLEETASAVGEINTRLGYTGEELEETTELFLNFADVTGDNAASAVASVTQLMNQWNVDASEMELILSKLTYAGQTSGISVSTLTSQLTNNKAILDQLGFSLDEAIAMFMNFELEGTQTSQVMMGFRTALSSGAISSLEELYEILSLAEQGLMSTEEAADIFGSRAGVAIVNAAQNGVFSLDALTEALADSSGTLETTAETAQTLSEKWEQAQNNIGTAFTTVLEPVISSASEKLAEIANSIGDFLNEHPTVTKAITVIGAALGAAAVAIATVTAALGVYTVATKIATAVTAAFDTALAPIVIPIVAVTAAVAALGAALYFIIDALDGCQSETEGMTATTKAQYYELQDLNAEYEEACDTYGATSKEASTLRYKLEDLTAEYNSSKQTIEEYTESIQEMVAASEEARQSYLDTSDALSENNLDNLALIEKMQSLAEVSDGSSASLTAINTIIDELNGNISGLDLSYDTDTGSFNMTADQLRQMALAQAEYNQQVADYEEYVRLIQEQSSYETELEKAKAELDLAQEQYDAAYTMYSEAAKYDTSPFLYEKMMGDYGETLEAAQEAYDAVESQYETTTNNLIDIENKLGLNSEEVSEAMQVANDDWATSAAYAYSSVQGNIEDLCEAYDEAYQAALESFQGQFDLFDEAQASSEATVSSAQTALESQLSYWQTYNSNMESIKNMSAESLGTTQENFDALIEYLSSGDEEAAGLAASIVANVESGNEAVIGQLAETYASVAQAQDEAAQTAADWQTDFTEQMEGFQQDMETIVDELDLSEEARASAYVTINDYVAELLNGKADAVAAAKAIASAVSAALSGTDVTVTASSATEVEGNASGTLDSADVFIAGENGPELIVGKQGSTVFPASETQKIIEAVSYSEGQPGDILYMPYSTGNSDEAATKDNVSEKKITLSIEGKGNINLTGGKVDEDTMVQFLYEYLKPVLTDIVSQEAYEEGDDTYGG